VNHPARKRRRRSRRKPRQGAFAELSRTWQRTMVPRHVVVVATEGRSVDDVVADMLHVPMDQSILLDFWLGHQPGSPAPDLDEDQVELLRLQYMLNHRYHGRRFDWLGDGLIARLARESIRTRSWDPFKEVDDET